MSTEQTPRFKDTLRDLLSMYMPLLVFLLLGVIFIGSSAVMDYFWGFNPAETILNRFKADAELSMQGSRANSFDMIMSFAGGAVLIILFTLYNEMKFEKNFFGNDPKKSARLPVSGKVIRMEDWLKKRWEQENGDDPNKLNRAVG